MFIILAESVSGLTMNFSVSLPVLGMWAHEEYLNKISIKITGYGDSKYARVARS
jgi:hypothetical protein